MSSAAALQSTTRNSQTTGDMPHPSLLLQRKCACGSSRSALSGECEKCSSKNRLQAKLRVGASNDPLELEADRVAEQVLAGPANPTVSGAAPRIQRHAADPSTADDSAPASVERVLADSGRPLDPAVQRDMGQRFSHDFSRVRVHSGAAAEQSARDVDANAYTVGHNIVFGAGQYAPAAHEGRRLLAHELTHVVQQGETRAPSAAAQTLRAQPKKKAPTKPAKPKIPMICGRRSRKVAGNEITQVNLDVGAHTLTIDWKDPKKVPSGSAGTHDISPGTGLCCKNCDDDKVSQSSGSLCTPKGGSWPVDNNSQCTLSGHPTAKNPTYFQRGGIAIHSGNTSSPPRSHGCARTSVSISELIHDNSVVGTTMIASSGTWTSSKCYMKENTDTLSNRKDVCDGNKLKSKEKKAGKGTAKDTPKNTVPKATVPPKEEAPKPAPPAVKKDIPVAEAPLLEDDDVADAQEEMLADGPGPNNVPLGDEHIGDEYTAEADETEATV